MELEFYTLEVSNLWSETTDSQIIEFKIPEKLKDKFYYLPGQYLTIISPIDEKERRCYSICSTPDDQGLKIGVKEVKDGHLSPYLVHYLKKGDRLKVAKPQGSFYIDTDSTKRRNYFFIAAGSGITPIRAMISTIMSEEPKSNIHLLYGNQKLDSIIFKNYFNDLAKFKNFNLIHVLEEGNDVIPHDTGRLTEEKIYELVDKFKVPNGNTSFYICGPTPVMKNSEAALKSMGVLNKYIYLEYFNSPTTDNTPILSKDRKPHLIKLNTSTGDINLDVKPGETILNAAIRNDIPMQYSCKSGICSSCKYKKISGNVHCANDTSLTTSEKMEGYILACQSYPLDNDVKIDCSDIKTYDKKSSRKFNRKFATGVGFLSFIFLFGLLTVPKKTNFLSIGPMNKGHENLQCEDCHIKSKGNLYQQLSANLKYITGQRTESVSFGSDNVDNQSCMNCHDRPNERHPVHRFLEPRFSEVKKSLGPHQCENCHSEHKDTRLFINELDFCQNCHQDTEIKDDPLDISHAELIAGELWSTCLQCHDFHGNHISPTPILLKDTIPITQIKSYAKGGMDPYGQEKEYIPNSEIEKIKDMLK